MIYGKISDGRAIIPVVFRLPNINFGKIAILKNVR